MTEHAPCTFGKVVVTRSLVCCESSRATYFTSVQADNYIYLKIRWKNCQIHMYILGMSYIYCALKKLLVLMIDMTKDYDWVGYGKRVFWKVSFIPDDERGR